MKRIILGRHSYTEYPTFAKDDLKRKLTEHGEVIAKNQTLKLQHLEIQPDLIISSNATRALQTSAIYHEGLKLKTAVKIQDLLYDHYTTDQFLQMIATIDESINVVLVVAHNPTISEIAYRLTPDFDSGMQPGTLAVIDYNVDNWKKIEVYEGILHEVIYP